VSPLIRDFYFVPEADLASSNPPLCDAKTGVFPQEERTHTGKPAIGYADVLRERMNVAQMALER
jgi:hypothetical protein